MFQGKSARFTWQDASQNDRGISGWVMSNMPHFDPGPGYTIAHDLLEHITLRAGNAGEAEAFGALVWVRLEGQYWPSYASDYRSNTEHVKGLAQEFGDFLHYSDYEMVAPLPDEVRPEPEDEEFRDLLRLMVLETVKYCRKEHGMEPRHRQWIKRMHQWLCIGYYDVQELYDWNAQAMASRFADLEQMIDQNIQDVQHQAGDEIEVGLNPDYSCFLRTVNGYDEMGDLYEDGEVVVIDEEEEDYE